MHETNIETKVESARHATYLAVSNKLTGEEPFDGWKSLMPGLKNKDVHQEILDFIPTGLRVSLMRRCSKTSRAIYKSQ